MVNSPLIRPYLLGGVALGGVPLGSHDNSYFPNFSRHDSRDKGTCTPNSVPMVFIVFSDGILGDNLPINTHVI